MPDSLHPPYADDGGALTVPRQLVRWLDINPQGGPLKRIQKYITLPAFSIANRWNGYSDIVATFNFEGPNSFSLKGAYAAPASPNYVLCISYHVAGVVTRYLLWDATGSNLNMDIPVYAGQPIKKNFRLEVWNTSQGASSQGSPVTFYTSVRGNYDYRFQTDQVVVAPGNVNTDFWAPYVAENNIILPNATYESILDGFAIGYQLAITLGHTYNYSVAPTGSISARVYVYDGTLAPVLAAGDPNWLAVASSPDAKFFLIDFPLNPNEGTPVNGGTITALDYLKLFPCPIVFPAGAVSTTN